MHKTMSLALKNNKLFVDFLRIQRIRMKKNILFLLLFVFQSELITTDIKNNQPQSQFSFWGTLKTAKDLTKESIKSAYTKIKNKYNEIKDVFSISELITQGDLFSLKPVLQQEAQQQAPVVVSEKQQQQIKLAFEEKKISKIAANFKKKSYELKHQTYNNFLKEFNIVD